jgi:hypothetical protein
MATQDLIDFIPVGYPGADRGNRGTNVAGSLMATQDLIDDFGCRILVGNPGADRGTIVA